jgi:hypothetical protein
MSVLAVKYWVERGHDDIYSNIRTIDPLDRLQSLVDSLASILSKCKATRRGTGRVAVINRTYYVYTSTPEDIQHLSVAYRRTLGETLVDGFIRCKHACRMQRFVHHKADW